MKHSLASLFAVAVLLAFPAAGFKVEGISLPMQQGDLKLQGAGLLKKGFVFKIYVGALYIENTNDVSRILDAVPKRIDIHYFHHTPKKHMIRVANKTLKRKLSEQTYTELLPKIEKLHEAYRNGEKGSCASILYKPGQGLTYMFDNEPVITIDCDDFANAYFSIWLGERAYVMRLP